VESNAKNSSVVSNDKFRTMNNTVQFFQRRAATLTEHIGNELPGIYTAKRCKQYLV